MYLFSSRDGVFTNAALLNRNGVLNQTKYYLTHSTFWICKNAISVFKSQTLAVAWKTSSWYVFNKILLVFQLYGLGKNRFITKINTKLYLQQQQQLSLKTKPLQSISSWIWNEQKNLNLKKVCHVSMLLRKSLRFFYQKILLQLLVCPKFVVKLKLNCWLSYTQRSYL